MPVPACPASPEKVLALSPGAGLPAEEADLSVSEFYNADEYLPPAPWVSWYLYLPLMEGPPATGMLKNGYQSYRKPMQRQQPVWVKNLISEQQRPVYTIYQRLKVCSIVLRYLQIPHPSLIFAL